jgi:hypothetical protein
MVLIAFLGPGLGCQSCKALRHNQMPAWAGDGKIRQRAGTTPPPAATRLADALVVPALWLHRLERSRVETESVRYPELMGIRYVQG